MSSNSSLSKKRARLAELQAEAAKLSAEIDARSGTAFDAAAARRRQELVYHATAGLFLGMVAALVSLMFNVIGASLVGENPLQLIKVYLTFGLGEQALSPAVDSGLALATGCMLYIATGMLLGGLFHVLLTRCAGSGGVFRRIAWATLIAVGIWVVNFYVLLSWIQPLLFGGNWITSMNPVYLPWWVAIATHVVFGWTMALAYPWGLIHRSLGGCRPACKPLDGCYGYLDVTPVTPWRFTSQWSTRKSPRARTSPRRSASSRRP